MKVADFNYSLPEELIAQFPSRNRGQSRLLHLAADGAISDLQFPDMLDILQAGDLLVVNDTRVIPARLHGQKDSGGRIEILLERILDESRFIAQIRSSKSPKPGQHLLIDGDIDCQLVVRGRQGIFFELEISQHINLLDWFEQVGHMPLPPYIERDDERLDAERYQTVFAAQKGAVAAPTAGLHYSRKLLEQLQEKGISIATITLHVGAGTYQPVRVATLEAHTMHAEYLKVDASVCEAIQRTKAAGNRVCAVGTTVVRSLEAAANAAGDSLIEPFKGYTDIFIYPGYQFRVVDMLQTNFHLPESTLLMLVSAFSGREAIMRAYAHAIEQRYRFFSYGDAMLLEAASSGC
ncbi:MAG: tRNA preQ1(34) S-adenosylmethionine ribosyltransferase-isomerase QueA [Arenicella sp.]|nr:tRNA preQ1(34) S-adenosylmethionine ribosyltransferase-isomerase QueA [Arenicella sp.]